RQRPRGCRAREAGGPIGLPPSRPGGVLRSSVPIRQRRGALVTKRERGDSWCRRASRRRQRALRAWEPRSRRRLEFAVHCGLLLAGALPRLLFSAGPRGVCDPTGAVRTVLAVGVVSIDVLVTSHPGLIPLTRCYQQRLRAFDEHGARRHGGWRTACLGSLAGDPTSRRFRAPPSRPVG